MKLKLEKKPGRGPCIEMQGPWVTEQVWDTVSMIMSDNWTTSPVYKARSKCCAFFQGGHHDSKGEWILLEFWSKEENCAEFIELLNQKLDTVVPLQLTRIPVNLYDYKDKGSLTLCNMIAEETGCPYDWGVCGSPFWFLPEDTVTYNKVMDLIRTFELKIC